MSTDNVEQYITKVAAVIDTAESKTRHVQDSEYWGLPIGTPIKPGMKPTGRKPRSRAQRGATQVAHDVTTPSGHTAPKRRVNIGKKPASDGKMPTQELGHELLTFAKKNPRKGDDATDLRIEGQKLDIRHRNGEDVSKELADWEARVNKFLGKKPDAKKDKGSDESAPLDVSVRTADNFSVEEAAKELAKISKEGREDGVGTMEDPIDVGDDVEAAAKALAEGKHIRMDTHVGLSSLLDKINEMAQDAKEKGDKAPEYDLCKVSIPGTNLFCIESKGIPRTNMPQFKGDAIEGSFAATKRDSKGEANVEPQFRELLDSMNISHDVSHMPAANLKASQENLDGVKVAGMMKAIKEGRMPQSVLDQPIFVTKDGYIVDGHHRWAALVALDMEDGVPGDIPIPVEVIDGDIGYTLDLANGFADMAGIKRKGLGANANAVKVADLMLEYADFKTRCCD